jgi:hypothetical protein
MKIDIKGGGNLKHFFNMLAWIELLGSVGHSADFKVFVDGDGNSRWKFKFENEEEQKLYNTLRKELCEEYINNHKDIEWFGI